MRTWEGKAWMAVVPALAILLLLPVVMRDAFYLHILILTFFFGAFSSSWNIIGGLGGQLSLGHAAFFGIGAYTATLLQVRLGINPWVGMLAGAGASAVVALCISYPCFRLRGPFFTLSTIAFAEVLRLIAAYWKEFTGGAVGILIPFRPGLANFIFASKAAYYYVALALMVVVALVSYLMEKSRMGYYLAALREDEDAAESCGVLTTRCKLLAVMVSAAFAGMCGVFYARYILFIDPDGVFNLHLSTQAALISIIGGSGTYLGPIIGAFLLVPLGEILRAWLGAAGRGLHLAMYGIILIAVVMVIPHGVIRWLSEGRFLPKHSRSTEERA